MRKRNVLFFIVLVVVILISIFFFELYLKEEQVSKYLDWFDEVYQIRIIEDKQRATIAYINDMPIYSDDLMKYAMLTSIDTNYFQQLSMDDCLESAEVLQSSLEEMLHDIIYILWADKEGLNYLNDATQQWYKRVLETQTRSKTPNIAAKSTIQIKYQKDYKLSFDGHCADKLIEEKYYPNFTDDPIEIGDYMLELILKETGTYNIVILDAAPKSLKTTAYLLRLKEQGLNVSLY